MWNILCLKVASSGLWAESLLPAMVAPAARYVQNSAYKRLANVSQTALLINYI